MTESGRAGSLPWLGNGGGQGQEESGLVVEKWAAAGIISCPSAGYIYLGDVRACLELFALQHAGLTCLCLKIERSSSGPQCREGGQRLSCPSAVVPQGRGGERAADVTACVPARAGMCAGSVLGLCAGLTWSHSRKVVVWGCVGA